VITDEGDFHASAFILGPDDTTVLIRDKRKTDPLWKFPGGKKQLKKPIAKGRRGETPLETLLREVHEETGLWLRKRLITHALTEPRGHYNKHFFFAQLPSLRGLVPLSNEYEEARVFTLEELIWLSDFHPSYRECYEHHIKPLIGTLGAEQ
jgi:8-oxo-dGTP pyrophosphatase MutT (NUDIX family)